MGLLENLFNVGSGTSHKQKKSFRKGKQQKQSLSIGSPHLQQEQKDDPVSKEESSSSSALASTRPQQTGSILPASNKLEVNPALIEAKQRAAEQKDEGNLANGSSSSPQMESSALTRSVSPPLRGKSSGSGQVHQGPGPINDTEQVPNSKRITEMPQNESSSATTSKGVRISSPSESSSQLLQDGPPARGSSRRFSKATGSFAPAFFRRGSSLKDSSSIRSVPSTLQTVDSSNVSSSEGTVKSILKSKSAFDKPKTNSVAMSESNKNKPNRRGSQIDGYISYSKAERPEKMPVRFDVDNLSELDIVPPASIQSTTSDDDDDDRAYGGSTNRRLSKIYEVGGDDSATETSGGEDGFLTANEGGEDEDGDEDEEDDTEDAHSDIHGDQHFIEDVEDDGLYAEKSTSSTPTVPLASESDSGSSDSTIGGANGFADTHDKMDLDGWEEDEESQNAASKVDKGDVKAKSSKRKSNKSTAAPEGESFISRSFGLGRRKKQANGNATKEEVVDDKASETSSEEEEDEDDDAPGGWAAYQAKEKSRMKENRELEKTANALAWEDEDVIANRSVLQSRRSHHSLKTKKAMTGRKANGVESAKKRPASEPSRSKSTKDNRHRHSRRKSVVGTGAQGNGTHHSGSSESDADQDLIEKTAAQTRKRKSSQAKSNGQKRSTVRNGTHPSKQNTLVFPTGRDAIEDDDDDEQYNRLEPLKAMQRPYSKARKEGSIMSDVSERLAYDEEKSYFRILRNEPQRRRVRVNERKLGSLTPEQTHYLKRALISMQMAREWGALGEVGALIQYGFPFRSTPFTVQPKGEGGEKAPILRALYQRFVYTFPNLKNASPEHFWQNRMQAFFDTFSSHNLSTTQDRGEVTKRRLLAMIATFFLSKLVNHAIRVCGDDGVPWLEKPVVLGGADLKAVEQLKPPDMPRFVHGVKIHIPKVDLVRPRHGRSRQEYVVCTERATGGADIYVSRGIDAFKRLHASLVASHPQIRVPAISPASGMRRLPHRLTLQGFLRELLHTPQLASSPHLIAFLGDNPLGPRIMTKDRRMRMQDLIDRDEHSLRSERRLWSQAAEQADRSTAAWRWLKDQLIYRDATLDRIHSIWKDSAHIDDWPLPWRKAEEFARIFVADFFHFLFVQSPMAAEIFGILRAIYSFVPWSLFRAALKIANPSLMMKTAVGIFLNKSPLAGGKSLLQRLISYIVNRDTKYLKREVANLESVITEKLKDATVCRLLHEYVHAPKYEQDTIRGTARKRNMDIVAAILLHSRQLGPAQVSTIMEAHAAFEATKESYSGSLKHTDEANPVVVEAMIYRNLKKLLRDYCRIRDREQVVKIVDETNTSLAIKSIVGVFYDPISEMSKASNLPERVGDLQRFLEDMINTIQYSDRSANRFVELCERHEMALYTFVRELWSSPKDIMDGLDVWFQIGLSFLKDGFASSVGAKPGYQKYINMDAVLDRPEIAPFRRQIMKEVDLIILHARRVKAVREVRRRNRYGQHIPPGTDDVLLIGAEEIGDFEGELSSLYLNTMVDSRDAKNLAADLDTERGDGGLAADDLIEDGESNGNSASSDRYTAQLRMAQASRQFPERQAIGARKPVRGIKGPRLTAIPMLLPYFLEELNPVLGFEGGRKEPKNRQRRNSNESSSKVSRTGSVSSRLSGFFK